MSVERTFHVLLDRVGQQGKVRTYSEGASGKLGEGVAKSEEYVLL